MGAKRGVTQSVGKKLSDLRLETATNDLRTILMGKQQGSMLLQRAPVLPVALQILPSKSIAQNLLSIAQNVPSKSMVTQTEKGKTPLLPAPSQAPNVASMAAVQNQAAALMETSTKGLTKAKKAKEPSKPPVQAAASADKPNKYIALFQNLDPAILQSLAVTIHQSLKVIS